MSGTFGVATPPLRGNELLRSFDPPRIMTTGEIAALAGGSAAPLASLAVTGNATVGGTLGVTGAFTATAGALLGTGTLSGLPYNFQSAIDYDPSTGLALSRQNIFNTTLTYSGDTTNTWEGLMSAVSVGGPGHANGEINVMHAYLRVRPGGTITQAEPHESSVENYGAITGTVSGYLAAIHNMSTGTVPGGSLFGLKNGLTTDNPLSSAIPLYAGVNFEALTGASLAAFTASIATTVLTVTGSPTGTIAVGHAVQGIGVAVGTIITSLGTGTGGAGTYNLSGGSQTISSEAMVSGPYPASYLSFRAADRYAAMASLGPLVLGTLTPPPTGTLLAITGLDTSGGTFVEQVRNSGGTIIRLSGDDGKNYWGNLASSVDVTGNFNGASYRVSNTQVVGARNTGWTAMTGTADKATVFDTASVTLPQLAARVLSMQAALTTHGLLGA